MSPPLTWEKTVLELFPRDAVAMWSKEGRKDAIKQGRPKADLYSAVYMSGGKQILRREADTT